MEMSQIICVPSGVIALWGTSTPPVGYLLCDGSAYSRTTYSMLFSIIGTTFGAGDGSATFNVPDLRGRFPLGKAAAGTGSTLAGTGGAIDHLHTVDPPATTTGAPSALTVNLGLLGLATAGSGTHTHSIDIPAFNSGTANPPFIVLNFIIKI